MLPAFLLRSDCRFGALEDQESLGGVAAEVAGIIEGDCELVSAMGRRRMEQLWVEAVSGIVRCSINPI